MNSSEKFYDRLTFLYPVIDIFLKPQKRKFFQNVNSFPSGQLLEIGVGDGAHFKYYNNHAVTGIDTSQSMLNRAAKNARNDIRLHLMNGETMQFPNETFDYVILSHVIAVVQDPDKLLKEVHRVLKPNGKVFILNHFTPRNWLRYLDKNVEHISSLFYFRSVFQISGLQQIRRFKLLSESNVGLFSYFKIMIYEKTV